MVGERVAAERGGVPGSALRHRPWRLPRAALRQAEAYLDRGQLSVRGFDRVLRMAWTVADLQGHASARRR